MVERRTSRGVPVPSFGQMITVGAALVAAWLMYSKYGRHNVDPDDAVADNPLESRHALDTFLWRGPNPDPIPVLLPGLDSQNPRERELAAYGLGQLGTAATPALDKLRDCLADEDAQVRANAALAFARISPDKDAAAATIAPLLADDDRAVRENAGIALFEIGPSAATPLLFEMLNSNEPTTRLAVARVLLNMHAGVKWTGAHFPNRDLSASFAQQIHPLCKSDGVPIDFMDLVGKPLIELLASDQAAIRLEAVRLLQYVPPGARWDSLRADLSGVFNDPDPGVRMAAFTAAVTWGVANPEQVRVLLHDPISVPTAYYAIGTMGEESSELLPDILALLDDETARATSSDKNAYSIPQHLQSVLGVLRSMKTAAKPATGRLVQIATTRRDSACIAIARTLHAIGADEDEVSEVLGPLLLHPDWARGLSWQAGLWMVELCPGEARRQVALLLPELGTNETNVNKTVLYALYALGPQAQEAVPAVVPLLQNRDPWVAEFAAHMLSRSGTDSADAAANLAHVASDHSLPLKLRVACSNALARCADALAKIGPAAQRVVPALLKIVGDPEPDAPLSKSPEAAESDVRAAMIRVLGRIGGDDRNLVPILRSQLTSRSTEVRAAAADALRRLAGQSAEGLADLVQRLRDDDAGVRAMAALAIGPVATPHPPAERDRAVAFLIGALTDESAYVRQAAAISLGELGPSARAALPALRELRGEGDLTESAAGSRMPESLQQFFRSGEPIVLDGFSFKKSAQTAIEKIENRSQDE